jgi:sialic acid synthase SpsE
VTTGELAQLVTGVRVVEQMRRHPVDKSAVAVDVAPLREIFMKSVVAQRDLAAGTVLGPEHLTAKKPGTGIPVSEIANLYGRRLRRGVKGDAALALDDLEPA